MTREEFLKLWPNATESTIRRNLDLGCLAPGTVAEQSSQANPVAADEGKVAYEGRCLVGITSFRRRLCDERNLYDKHFVDALTEAGAFADDSPEFVQVIVGQVKVEHAHEERTVIILSPCLPK
jgi:hypothetical protein